MKKKPAQSVFGEPKISTNFIFSSYSVFNLPKRFVLRSLSNGIRSLPLTHKLLGDAATTHPTHCITPFTPSVFFNVKIQQNINWTKLGQKGPRAEFRMKIFCFARGAGPALLVFFHHFLFFLLSIFSCSCIAWLALCSFVFFVQTAHACVWCRFTVYATKIKDTQSCEFCLFPSHVHVLNSLQLWCLFSPVAILHICGIVYTYGIVHIHGCLNKNNIALLAHWYCLLRGLIQCETFQISILDRKVFKELNINQMCEEFCSKI